MAVSALYVLKTGRQNGFAKYNIAEEYVKLTRDSGKLNNKFEKTHSKDFESFFIKDNEARHLDNRHLEP